MAQSALLLAAGLGSRLRPLTNVLPKCLAPIRGRPLLEYWLRMLVTAGYERIVVNTYYLPELVEAYLAGSPWAKRVVVVRETSLLGTGGTLVANAALLGNGPVLVAHADNLSVFDAAAFRAAHAARPRDAALTMMTFTTDAPSSCGIVTTDNTGLVNGFFEKVANPPGNRANGAVYLFEPEVVRFAAGLRKVPLDLSTEVLPHYVGRMWPWHNDGYHRDIGTMESWRAAQRDYPLSLPAAPHSEAWLDSVEAMAPGAKALIVRELEST